MKKNLMLCALLLAVLLSGCAAEPLQGQTVADNIQNVDCGCVWGNQLMAYRLEDQQLFAVDNPLAEW